MTEGATLLLISRNLPPLLGGMERLNQKLVELLAEEFSVIAVGPTGCAAFLPSAVRVGEVPLSPLPWFLVRAAAATLRLAQQYRPGWVLAGSGLTAPIAWLAARLGAGRFAVYVHGLDLVVDSAFYRWFWLPFVRRADRVIANSTHTAALAAEVGVAKDRIRVVNPGCEVPAALADPAFRERHYIGSGPLLLSVGRLTARKGLHEFVHNILPRLIQAHPSLQLVIVGDDPAHALLRSRGSEKARIVAMADELGLRHAVRFLPKLSDAELSAAYLAADVHVFPLQRTPGDVEGFGMVAAEAAAHGLPTVAFDVGGVGDAIVPGQTGSLVRAGDDAQFAAAVLDWLGRAQDPAIREACRAAASRWSWSTFGRGVQEALGTLPGASP